MDVKSAFLYGTIDEEVYVIQPPGFQDPKSLAKVYKVEKAMYGLHQAPRAKNDVKARTTLLLSLPDEHQLQFSKHKTAQELWVAILKTFGGNEATKKTKKNLLKQHLAPEWLMHTIVWRNRSGLDTMSLDDLYNHLKVYESEVQKKSEPNSQNMAFISSAKHSRGNEEVNTASVSTASTNVPTASANIGVASISQETAYAYIASQSSGSQFKFEDINQIDEDDMEEMDIKWNMDLLSMRANRFWKKTGKKISIQGSDVARFDKSNVECFNCHKMAHFTRECRAPRSQDRGRRDNYRQGSKVEEQAPKALMAIDGKNSDSLNSKVTDLTDKLFYAKNMIYHYKLGLAQVESRLAEHRNRETKYCEKIKGLELKVEFKTNTLENLKKEVELIKKEKEELETKLTGFKTASKDLDSLLESQRMDKNKERLGYSDVPPPPAQLYSSPKKDLSWTGLSEFKDDTVTDYSRPSPAVESTSDDAQNRNPSVTKTEASPSTISPKSFIKFVKAKDSPTNSKTDKAKTTKKSPVKYAEQYRKLTNIPNKKACFNCGDFNHLAYDCRKRMKKGTSRSQNNTHKSPTPRPVAHRPNRPPMRLVRTNMNGAQPNRTSFNKQAHSYTNRPFQRTSAVRSQYRAPWVPSVNRNFPSVNRNFSTVSRNFSTVNRKFPTANRKFPTGDTKFSTPDMGKKGKVVKPSACWFWKPLQNLSNKGPNSNSVSVMFKKYTSQNNIDDKGYWDSGCSRHMTGNISYRYDYEPFDGGYVSFGQGGCKITGKGTIKTGKLKFENVYFVKDLKYNLFSMSQICDNKNSVLFTESECIVLRRDFKLLDDANVLFRTPRQHNMYSIDLNNIVPHKDLICLIAKASVDECMIWHRRLGHLNFKTMNRLVRHNLVRGLPSKCFENDHTCTACLKGKQHKASCKSKLVNSVTKLPHTLHMDLFGPTSVSSINHEWYCLVVTDDFSRFTWTFFLKTKDATSGILRKFITEIENLMDLKVKIIRCDNGGEFRNKKINDFCSQKGIKREFSNARTPQQNGVAERRNRTLIEAARTMLADAKLPITFWAEAVYTAYNFGKFKAKGDEGYFIGYSMSNKAFRAHDALLKSSSSKPQDDYSTDVPESSKNSNPTATSTNPLANQVETLTVETLIPTISSLFEDILGVTTITNESNRVEADVSNMETSIKASPTPILRIHKDHPKSQIIGPVDTLIQTRNKSKEKVWSLVDCPKGVRPIGTKWVLKNKKDERGIVIKNKARLVAQRHTQEEGIDYDEVFAPVARIKAIILFLAYASFMDFTVYQIDVKSAFLYGTIDEELCGEFKALMHEKFQMSVMGELNFFLGLQVLQKEDGIFLSQDKFSMPWEAQFKGITSSILPFSNIATALACLATNRTYNFSKMIFDGLGEGLSTPTVPHHTPSLEAQQPSHTPLSSPTLPPVTTVSTAPIPTVTLIVSSPLRQYTRRARIAQSSALSPVADEPASPLRDVSQGEACPTDSGLVADQDKANIAKTSTLPHEQQSELVSKFEAQALEIIELKARVKFLEDRQGEGIKHSGDDAPIKGRRLDEGEAATERLSSDREEIRLDEWEAAAERVSNDSEEMVTVLTSIDAASVLASGGVQVVPTAAAVPTATISTPTGSGVVPTASLTIPTVAPIFTTATRVTPYTRRKGKEKMVKTDTPKKKKRLQEHIDVQFARELEEELERDAQRMNEQIARDAEIARIHTEEELQIMIDGLDRNNYAKVHKFQTQQRKPWSKNQKKDYYMSVIKSNLGWKVKDFRGMTFEELEAKFTVVWKQVEDFIPMGSKEAAERFKRKKEEEKVKEMIQLVPIEEVYVEALQVKYPIIDWKVHTEGQRSYWKIIRLEGSSASYHMDREDLNQLWALVKESLSNRPPTSDKEMKL
nr:hypothetical protein [Tanacetum cinerariifolium]